MADRPTGPHRGFSRRHLLGGGAAALGAAGLGWGAHEGADHLTTGDAADGGLTEPFHGPHQGGIATEPQAHAQFVGLDLRPGADRATVTGLLKVWTQDAARLAGGAPALADTEPELAATPARLTVTIGLGPGVFTASALTEHQPSWLRPLPAFPIDHLDETAWGQTDLLLQICADDPVTVAHTVRVLTKNARSLVSVGPNAGSGMPAAANLPAPRCATSWGRSTAPSIPTRPAELSTSWSGTTAAPIRG